MLSSWQEEKDNYVIVITHYARLTIRQSRLYTVEETNPRVMNSSRVTVYLIVQHTKSVRSGLI